MTVRVEHIDTKTDVLPIAAKSQVLSPGFREGGYRTEYRVTLDGIWVGMIRKDVYQPRTREWVVFLHDETIPAGYDGTLGGAMTHLARLHLARLVFIWKEERR